MAHLDPFPDGRHPAIWILGGRGKSTIGHFLQSILAGVPRAPRLVLPCPTGGVQGEPDPIAAQPESSVESWLADQRLSGLQPEDCLVVADTRGDGAALQTALSAARSASRLVLDASDPEWGLLARSLGACVTWVGDGRSPEIRDHLDRGGDALLRDGDELVVASGEAAESLLAVGELPALLGGAAEHQVRNVLAAAAGGLAMGLSLDSVRRGLRAVDEQQAGRLGRCTSLAAAGMRVLLDRAPDAVGLEAVVATAMALPAERRVLLLGSIGAVDPEAWERALERLGADQAWIAPGPGRERLATRLAALGVRVSPGSSEEWIWSRAQREAAPGDLWIVLRCAEEPALEAAQRLLPA